MPCYRIRLMDEVGTVTSLADHDCSDDDAAAELAVTLLPQRAQAEVWLGTRLVGAICTAVEAGRQIAESSLIR
jgi:hypothetical protein